MAPVTTPGLHRRALAIALAIGWVAPAAGAEARFPERPVTLVVPFAPGGIADITARTVGAALARQLGVAVVVDNRPGAGSIAASQAVAGARPDGHTLLLMSNGHAVSVGLFRQLPYDPQRDFAPVGTIGLFDLAVVVPASSPWQRLDELVAAARARPGQVPLATVSVGSTQHLAAKLLEARAGIDLLTVPYKATPAVLTALRGGEVAAAVEILGPLLPQVRAGALRVLAVASPQRHPALPEVPTAAQAGLAGFEVASWNGLAVPAATPPELVARLNQALRAALAQPEVQARLAEAGLRLAPGTPAELQALLAAEIRRWGAVIRAAKIEPE